MLLCDGCDRGYHIYCLKPPLKKVPRSDWFCSDCIYQDSDFGFEEGGEYSLTTFMHKAKAFKSDWFKGRIDEDMSLAAENIVEEEFWRIVDSPFDSVQVEYGADLHSTEHGRL